MPGVRPVGLLAGCHARRRHGGEHGGDDVAGVDAVGDGVEGQQQPVRDDVAGHVGDVAGQDVVAAAQQREGAAGRDEAEGGARAGAELEQAVEVAEAVAVRVAGRDDERHRVLRDGVVDEHGVRRLLERQTWSRVSTCVGPGGSTLIRWRIVNSSSSVGWSTSTLSRNRSRWASGSW